MDNFISEALYGLKLQDYSNVERVKELLDRFDLNWKVSKEDLFLADGTKTDYKAVVRTDNNEVFQTCKDSYLPYQNSELAELLIRISERGGYEIHEGGHFKGGAKTFVQLVTGNQITDIGNNRSKVIGYTTGLNSHDGSVSLKWGSTNKTICCQNVFNAVSKQLTNSARHTTNLQDKVDAYLTEIGVAIQQEKTLFDRFIELAGVPVKAGHIAKVVNGITGVDIMNKDTSKFSTYNVNRSGELLNCIQQEMHQKGETLWGLLSGVTNYTTHVIPVPNRDNARLESKYVGTANKIDHNAFNLISSLY